LLLEKWRENRKKSNLNKNTEERFERSNEFWGHENGRFAVYMVKKITTMEGCIPTPTIIEA